MNITLKQLKIFETVARRESFTRAAEELYLTQPAVSMQIRQLEETVGLPLFERLGKRIYITEAGQRVFELSKEIRELLGDTESALEELKDEGSGNIVVSVVTTVHHFAINLLADFCKTYPKIKVDLNVTNRKGLFKQLEDNQTDVVLMGLPPEDLDVEAELLMENPLVVIAPTTHPLAQKQQIDLDVLTRETFLIREKDSGTRSSVQKFFTQHNLEITRSMEMNSDSAIKQGVEVGLGLGIVSVHTIRNELEENRLCVLDVKEFPIIRHWYLAHRSGKRLSPAAKTFEAFVRKESKRYL